MISDTSPYPDAPPPPRPPAAGHNATSGWTGSDLAIGGALIVLLISLFLPWFGSPDIDGPTSHGYLWIAFALAIVALIVIVARDAIARLPGNLPSPEQMLVGTTGLILLLTILGIAQTPSASATSVVIYSTATSLGWSYGGWVALVAALVALIAAFREVRPPQPTQLMTILLLRRRGGD
jgi:hypothetical protein